MITILFLSANPAQTDPLDLIKECNTINQKLRSSASGRDLFMLEQSHDISIKWLIEELLNYNPQILHFSGHGSEKSVLIFKNENTGQIEEVPQSALSEVFRVLGGKIDLVFLNACYSEKQARAIAEHVKCVIGISNAITDSAAIEFASTFYISLGFGKSVKAAFDLATVLLELYDIPERDIPQLLVKEDVDASKIFIGQTIAACPPPPFPSTTGLDPVTVGDISGGHGIIIGRNITTGDVFTEIDESIEQNRQSKSVQEFKEIERYPSARFPNEVGLNDIIPLEVIIKSDKSLSNHLKSSTIKIKVDKENQKEIPVQVIVEFDDDGFEIEGKYYAIINVPVELKDSNPVIFSVKSKKEGKHTIHIRFFQQTTYVGQITLESLVTSSKNQRPLFVPDSQIKEWKSDYAILENTIPGPDITIFIHERKVSSEFEYDVLVSSLDIPIQEMGPIKFQFNPEAKFHKIFEDIENLRAPSPNILDRKIKAKGMSLYDELFPESLKQLYWEKREKIKSIRIISKEPWIPWEIIKPWHKLEDGSIEEDEFLCEHYAFSRWLVGKHERIKTQIKNVKVIVPEDTNLIAAIKERNWIEAFAKNKNIKISFDSSYDQVINTFETEKEIDILHFSTHGQNNTESPLLSEIQLEGNVKLRPEEIIGKAMTFGQSHPIVILNACQTGNQNFSLTGIQGWATKFLEAGTSVFIGTLWSVNDETAFNFVKEFYNQLSSGVTLGESVKNARNKSKKEGDTSWLAYQLYGHPNCTIKIIGTDQSIQQNSQNEYLHGLKELIERLSEEYHKYNVPQEKQIQINQNILDLVKEVKDLKLETKIEDINNFKLKEIKTKTRTLIEEVVDALPEASVTIEISIPLRPFSKLIRGGVQNIFDAYKNYKESQS